ncbi:DUF6087 family protein [Streptomyces sp. PSKA30]|uniref:DUF6087 family protein n=1 Tax=Streptomyces sp. PSKA30 TaxID=2874597 RepID=UPI001CD04D76|nr:DUF6087 family protein [Streptomyces sp. PSKA30]MBZ9638197.1 DUF6087 family protein [Streptomyces sp. PSKA30]
MDDEPLKDWAERRDAKIGRLRAVPVVSGDGPREAHLNPDAPRAIERWNGYVWEPHGFAADLAEAQAILYPEASEPPTPGPAPKPLGSGTGKHRKPQAPRSDGGGRTRA